MYCTSQCIFSGPRNFICIFLTHTYRQNECNFQINRHFKFFVTGEYHNLLSYMLQHWFLTIEQCSNHWHALRDYQSYPEINCLSSERLTIYLNLLAKNLGAHLTEILLCMFIKGQMRLDTNGTHSIELRIFSTWRRSVFCIVTSRWSKIIYGIPKIWLTGY